MKSVFIFRRDLRIIDNTTLIEASKLSNEILPIFIFDPRQIEPEKNEYFSNNCVQFMIESLEDLDKQLAEKGSRLFYFYGIPEEVLKNIQKEFKFEKVFFNKDYTPFSKKRDENISKDFEAISYDDIIINPFDEIRTGSGTVYMKFTPFYNKAKLLPLKKANNYDVKNFTKKSLKLKCEYKKNIHDFYTNNPNILHNGGRKNAIIQLNKICEQKNYEETRDIPSIPTSQLSAFNKFGCISIRELFDKLKVTIGLENGFARQLYFRDFYYYIVNYYPKVLEGKSFYEKFDKIKWTNNPVYFDAWKKGLTGIPLVDSGMRQMLWTGFMHNRVRMLVASFLTKNCGIDWRWGEKWFANYLGDYCVIQNNCGWESTNGMGPSPLEWFRIMNPITQAKKYDKNCLYIKKWIPELKDIDCKDILNMTIDYTKTSYPKPIVDISKSREEALKRYENALKD
jgi:deoxyribodipyrimidine photo-lyase